MKSKIVFAAMIVANLVLVATFVATSPSQASADGTWCCSGTKCEFRSSSGCWLSPECQGDSDCELPEQAN